MEFCSEMRRLWWELSSSVVLISLIVVGQTGMWAESSSPSVGHMGQENGSGGGRQILLFLSEVHNFLCRSR